VSSTWIVNASPLIGLAKIGRLDLLREAGREILIPAAAAKEILAGPAGDPAAVALRGPLSSRVFDETVLDSVVEWGLGAGETAVISAALKRKAFAVIDDKEARNASRALGVSFVGTLGVVLLARQEGRLERAAEILRRLQQIGLRLDDRLVREALRQFAEESWDF
jgi:predicted nucleic acid-binding protein